MHSQSTRRLSVASLVLFVYFLYRQCPKTSASSYSSHRMHNLDLLPFTKTIFLPYVHDFKSKDIPMLKTTIDGRNINMPMDTGSTGVLIGAPLLSNVGPKEGIRAYKYFSSSNVLSIGRLVHLPITFHGALYSWAEAKVPVLVVDESWICSWYDPSKPLEEPFKCPRSPDGEEASPRDTSGITYMGVGFGRNGPAPGQPGAEPGANPFLNIRSIVGMPLDPGSFRSGYVVSTHGVYVGLTEHNTRDFVFTKLDPGIAFSTDARDWAMAKACFRINGAGSHCSSALVDTGIPQIYIRAAEGVSMPSKTMPKPNPDGNVKVVTRVAPGTRIHVGFPSLAGGWAAAYEVVVPEDGEEPSSAMAPSHVGVAKHAPPPYVNTGRNFLFGYSIAFDATGGRFGFRAASPSTAKP